MNIIKPKPLKKGDTIGFLSVSGEIGDRTLPEFSRRYFESKGYKVKYSENLFYSYNGRCGTDTERLKALHDFFEDASVDAIICARGGYGALRLVNNIDYELIKQNPKIFVGFSDITALSLMFFKNSGLLTFSGPMVCSDFYNIAKFTEDSFFESVTFNQKTLEFSGNKTYSEGCAEGILWGGNLATIASLCGVDFVPEEKFILFIEDTGEPVYKIDRMISQLMNIKKFRKYLAGIVLGDFGEIGDKDCFDSLFSSFDVPVKSGLSFGHIAEKITIPIGAGCVFDTAQNEIGIKL